jgi:hypothetical protein
MGKKQTTLTGIWALLYEDRCLSIAAVSRQTKKLCLSVLCVCVVRIYSASQSINLADLTERLRYVIELMKTYTKKGSC